MQLVDNEAIENILSRELKAIEGELAMIAGKTSSVVSTIPDYMIAGIKAYKERVSKKIKEGA